MLEKLRQLGINRIIIADDAPENLAAARTFSERILGFEFEFYQRGDLLVAQIPKKYREIGLILTDREMETKDAGLDVLETSWMYHVPAFVCSGGYRHANQPRLRVAPHIKGFHLPDGMVKDNPDTWYQILEGVVNDATGEGGSLLHTVLRARKVPFDVPDEFTGREVRECVRAYLDLE